MHPWRSRKVGPRQDAYPTYTRRHVCRLALAMLPLASCAILEPPVELPPQVIETHLTSFGEALMGLGRMSEIYETPRVAIQIEPATDETGISTSPLGPEVQKNITEIVLSRVNAIGGRVIAVSYPLYEAVPAVPAETLQRPDKSIRGGITELNIEFVKSRSTDLSIEGNVHGRPLGLDLLNSSKVSRATIAVAFTLVDFASRAGVPRVQTMPKIHVSKGVTERELAFTLLWPTAGLRGSVLRIQGRHAGVSLLVEVAVLQLIGRSLRLPYWRLVPQLAALDTDGQDYVRSVLQADFARMSPRQQLAAMQRLLVLHGFLDVMPSGVWDTPTAASLQTFAFTSLCRERACVNYETFWQLYISVPLERTPPAAAAAGEVVRVQAQVLRASTLHTFLSGAQLTAHDRYMLTFIPHRHAFVYVFLVHSQGPLHRLFASEDGTPVQPGTVYRLPTDNVREWLRPQGGRTEIVLLAFVEPPPEGVLWKALDAQGGLVRSVLRKTLPAPPQAPGIRDTLTAPPYVWQLTFTM